MRAMMLVVMLSSMLLGGDAFAVDRGQFADVPENIRNWFKSVVSPSGLPCCDIADGHRTEYDVRNNQYFVPIDGLWWQVPDRAVIRNSGNPGRRGRGLVCAPERQCRHQLLRAGGCRLRPQTKTARSRGPFAAIRIA